MEKGNDILSKSIVQINTPHHRAAHAVRICKLLLQIESIFIIIRHKLVAIANLHHLRGWVVLRCHIGLGDHVLNLRQRHHTSLTDTRTSRAETTGWASDVVACVVGEGVATAVGCETHVDLGQVDAGGGEGGDGGVDDTYISVTFDVGGGVAVGVQIV